MGGAGYTAGELIRILLHHPEVDLKSVVSQSHGGDYLYKAHPDLTGETQLKFELELNKEVDVVFLCSGHGKSKKIVESGMIPVSAKIIDLSTDFRHNDDSHDFIYGLPELNRENIKKVNHVANPGCYATCIQLTLLPLASAGLLKEDAHVTAITGSTGAGQNPTAVTHFSWRSHNASVYKPLTHRHLKEIKKSLVQLQNDFRKEVYFIPMRGAFTRGILATSYTPVVQTLEEVKSLYHEFYKDHPFVHLSENPVDVKLVVGTNKALLHLQKEKGQILITGVIDNLLKGASGQAVQNMNLVFALDETIGLTLKSTAF